MTNVSFLIGLGKRDSQNKVEAMNLIYRLCKVDGEEIMPFPEDKRDDRVCIEINNGKVSSAVLH